MSVCALTFFSAWLPVDLTGIEAFDRALFVLISQSWRGAALDHFMLIISDKWNFAVPGAALLMTWLIVGGEQRRKLRLLLFGVALIAVTDVGATALKKLIERPRPCVAFHGSLMGCSTSPSLPSNHAANAFAFAAFAIGTARTRHRWWYAVPALIAYSRVYVGVHYPFDVVAGALFGASLGHLAAHLARVTATGSRRRHPVPTRAAAAPAPSPSDRTAGLRSSARARAARPAGSRSGTTAPG
jgi:undecaprenyl-diphosphatase